MLGGFQAVLAFLFLFMPGAMFLAGYEARGSDLDEAPRSLQRVGEAVALSLLLDVPGVLILAADITMWLKDGTVGNHLTPIFLVGYATLFLPFVVGMLLSVVVAKLPWLRQALRLGSPWSAAVRRGKVGSEGTEGWVAISLDDNTIIKGTLDLVSSRYRPGGSLYLSEVEKDKPPHIRLIPADKVRWIQFEDRE